MIIKWTKKSNGKTYDITYCVGTVTWSGSVEQAAREASITVLNAPNDPNITALKLNIAAGDVIQLYDGKTNIFYGEIQTSTKTSEIGTITYNARDLMDHLLRIDDKQNFKKKTPEAIAKLLCKKYGITPGKIVSTKKAIKAILENNIYDMIMYAYTKAAKSTGKKYMPYMDGKKFCVKVKGTIVSGYTLDEKANISQSNYEESIENMVDQVKIFNDKGKQVGIVKNDSNIKRYGIYQAAYTKEKDINPPTAAKNLLVGITKKVTVTTTDGDVKAVAGEGIKLKDGVTGLDGLFWISNDSHTWENGNHTMTLELEFKNVMDEQTKTGGKKKKKIGSGTSKEMQGTYVVTSTTTIMRASAGRKGKSVATLKKGATIKSTGQYTYVSGTAWIYGTSGGKSGYVYSKSIEKK